MATKIRTPILTGMSREMIDGGRTLARPASMSRRLPAIARLAMVLETLLGIGALFGGGQFILAPDGHLIGVPLKMLAGTPFHSFLVPELLLFTFVGVAPIAAAGCIAP